MSIAKLPDEEVQAILSMTEEDQQRAYDARHAKVEQRFRSWLSHYDDNGELKPGAELWGEDAALERMLFQNVDYDERRAYIVAKKRGLEMS